METIDDWDFSLKYYKKNWVGFKWETGGKSTVYVTAYLIAFIIHWYFRLSHFFVSSSLTMDCS